jgi:hypothetical protein
MMLAPQAVREGWDSARLAKEARISTHVAQDVMALVSAKVHNKADRELGVLANTMREAAHTAVPATVELCQRTLSACHRVVDRLEADIQEFQTIPGKHGDTPASIVLAGAAQKLASAMSTLGATIKDLTGLKAAEDVAKKRAGERVKKDDSVDPWAMDFEPLDVTSD